MSLQQFIQLYSHTKTCSYLLLDGIVTVVTVHSAVGLAVEESITSANAIVCEAAITSSASTSWNLFIRNSYITSESVCTLTIVIAVAPAFT